MNDIDMLFCIVAMVLGAFLIYYPMKDESPRQKVKKLADSVASDKKNIDYQIQRFSYLLDNMAADNGKGSALKYQIARLEEIIKELNSKRKELESSNRSMTGINNELKRSNAELLKKALELRDEIQQQELKIQQQEEYISSAQRVKEGLEIALDNIQAEEVHYLSQPIFSMKMTPIVRSKLESHGILYIGDLIQLNEEYLMEIWGIGPVALERIKTKLNENGVWFGMDVIRINDRWYRRKQELTTD